MITQTRWVQRLNIRWANIRGFRPGAALKSVFIVAMVLQGSLGLADEKTNSSHNAQGPNAVNNQISIQPFLNLYAATPAAAGLALLEIDRKWQPSSAIMLLEAVYFSTKPAIVDRAIKLLQAKTGQTLGKDFDEWYRWVWRQKHQPHPDYATFKSRLYSKIDPRFAEYFEQPDGALIRLEEVRWGGVRRDGIPPLKDPKMLSAKEATYLDDTDVVFGVNLNGDARCYPKRILAWHEMFKDTIGGLSVCGAY